jgi:hypothetical protein
MADAQVTEQNPSSGIWKGFRCGAYNGVMTRTGYFPANAVVLIDPQRKLLIHGFIEQNI